MASLHRRDPHILHVIEASDVPRSCLELRHCTGTNTYCKLLYAMERTKVTKQAYSCFMHTSWRHVKIIHCKGLQKQRPAGLTVHHTRLTSTIANCENAAHLLHAGIHAQNHELDQFQKCNCKREVALTYLISKHRTSSIWHTFLDIRYFRIPFTCEKRTKALYTLGVSIIFTLTGP
jgi:hypothetical protein